jgi:hypothetical protein
MDPRFRAYARLGKAINLKSKPPGVGESFRTRIADSWDGIRFEIGRMCEMVRHGIGDPLVIDQAGWNLSTIEDDEARRNPVEMARAQFHWVRGVFQYVPDSYRMEKLETANRQIRRSKIPKEIIMAATAPIYASRTGKDLGEMTFADIPGLPVKISGDCDEASTLAASLVSACGIRTRFMLGRIGDGEGFHHVWAQADVLGDGSDNSFEMGSMDVTEPEFDELGKFATMDAYKPVEIWQ